MGQRASGGAEFDIEFGAGVTLLAGGGYQFTTGTENTETRSLSGARGWSSAAACKASCRRWARSSTSSLPSVGTDGTATTPEPPAAFRMFLPLVRR